LRIILIDYFNVNFASEES